MDADGVAARIRWVDGFPRPGVRFADLSPVIADGHAFAWTIETITNFADDLGVTKIAGIESRGFWFAAPVADRLQVGMVPIRKAGRLPYVTYATEVVLEYGTATLEVHQDGAGPGDRVLVIDDVLATGGTAAAGCHLVEMTGASVAGVAVVVELAALGGRGALPEAAPLFSLVIA